MVWYFIQHKVHEIPGGLHMALARKFHYLTDDVDA